MEYAQLQRPENPAGAHPVDPQMIAQQMAIRIARENSVAGIIYPDGKLRLIFRDDAEKPIHRRAILKGQLPYTLTKMELLYLLWILNPYDIGNLNEQTLEYAVDVPDIQSQVNIIYNINLPNIDLPIEIMADNIYRAGYDTTEMSSAQIEFYYLWSILNKQDLINVLNKILEQRNLIVYM